MNSWEIPIMIAFGVSWMALIGMCFVATESLRSKDREEFAALGGKEGYFFLYIHPLWLLYMGYIYILFGRYRSRGISSEAKSTFNVARVVSVVNVLLGATLIYVTAK